MLVNLRWFSSDQLTSLLGGGKATKLGTGLYQNPDNWFGGDMTIWGKNDFDRSYVDIGELSACGVCDSPEQFKADHLQTVIDDPRPFVVFFTHVHKEPENRGRGGGWRWHKWGPYIGKGQPEMEYLDDEDGFADGIYCYHIYLVDNVSYEAKP